MTVIAMTMRKLINTKAKHMLKLFENKCSSIEKFGKYGIDCYGFSGSLEEPVIAAVTF